MGKKSPPLLLWIALLLGLYNTWRVAQLRHVMVRGRGSPPVLREPEGSPSSRQKEQTARIQQAWDHAQQAQALLREGREAEAEREIGRLQRTLSPFVAKAQASAPEAWRQEGQLPLSASLSESFRELLQERVRREERRSR